MMKSAAVFRNLATEDGNGSGIVHGYTTNVMKLLFEFQPDYFIPLFDNGRSSYRTSIRAEYKGNRGKKSDDKLSQFKACREFEEILGFTPYSIKNTEADDLAAAIVHKYSKENYIQLWTTDHDWRQLLNDNTVMIKTIKGRSEVITEKKATEELGLDIHRWPEIAAIVGDPGDGVYGIKGIGYGKAKKFIAKYGDLWNAVTSEPILIENSKTILENYELTRLDGSVASSCIDKEDYKIDNLDNVDSDKMNEFFDRWQLNSAKRMFADGII
jgi:DNA polymerase-1